MRKRNKIIIFSTSVLILIGVLVLILFVKKRDKYVLYETDIQGEWINKTSAGDLNWIFYSDKCVQEDYLNHFVESVYDIKEIYPDFYKINAKDLHVDNYKYYNIIGQVFDIQGDIPNAEKFNLVINEGLIKIEFDDSGVCKFYFDFYSDGNLKQMWEMKYYMKDNIIYNIDNNNIPRYYLINNFLFDPIYYKK